MSSTTRVFDGEATRDALTRVLSIESRNALARVKLAASELSRYELTPSAQDRIATIHDAVSEIDQLLAKIDLLASPKATSRGPGVDVLTVWRRIRSRLDATLAARGIAFEDDDSSLSEAVDLPDRVLESILCGILRVVLASIERNQELRFEVRRELETIRIGVIAVEPGCLRQLTQPIDREMCIELEVQLAEWGGSLYADGKSKRFEVALPAGVTDV